MIGKAGGGLLAPLSTADGEAPTGCRPTWFSLRAAIREAIDVELPSSAMVAVGMCAGEQIRVKGSNTSSDDQEGPAHLQAIELMI